MRITTKGRYGVRAVLYLATSYYNRPVSIKSIAEHEDISPEFLEQIFFKLKKVKIINSVRGPGGGFVLNKKPAEISLKDILDALGEPIEPVPCSNDLKKCKRKEECLMSSVWQDFSDILNQFLTNTTIKIIIDKGGIKYYDKIESGQDFSI